MLQESKGQDHFLEMIDKLCIMNLSIDGAAILKSMADAIRCALEKGLLLEQIIINQRNNSIENSSKTQKKSKKKKHKKSVCLDDSDINVSQSDDVPQTGTSTEQEKFTPESCLPKLDSCRKPDIKVQKELGLPNSEPVNNSTDTSRNIKLVEQSYLVDPSLSFSCELKSSANTDQNNFTHSLNDQSNKLNCNQTKNLQQLPQYKTDQFNQVNDSMNSVNQNNLISSKPVTLDKMVIKQEYTDAASAEHQLNSSMSSDSSRATNMTSPFIEPPAHNFEPPTMPSPIVIKSEHKHVDYKQPSPEEFVPFNLTLNVTNPTEQMKVSPPGNTEAIQGCDEESGNCKPPQQQQEDEYKVFVEAGKGATEEEVRAVFKDLDIVFIRVINKPAYSFGFVSFSTEESMKTAISLSGQSTVAGKSMLIRPCYKNRCGRKFNTESSEHQQNNQSPHHPKRPGSPAPIDANKKVKLSNYTPPNENYKMQRSNDRFKADRRSNFDGRNCNDLHTSPSNNDTNPSCNTYSYSEKNQSGLRDQETRSQCKTTDHATFNDRYNRDSGPHRNSKYGDHRNFHNYRNDSSRNFRSRNLRANFFNNRRGAQKKAFSSKIS